MANKMKELEKKIRNLEGDINQAQEVSRGWGTVGGAGGRGEALWVELEGGGALWVELEGGVGHCGWSWREGWGTVGGAGGRGGALWVELEGGVGGDISTRHRRMGTWQYCNPVWVWHLAVL